MRKVGRPRRDIKDILAEGAYGYSKRELRRRLGQPEPERSWQKKWEPTPERRAMLESLGLPMDYHAVMYQTEDGKFISFEEAIQLYGKHCACGKMIPKDREACCAGHVRLGTKLNETEKQERSVATSIGMRIYWQKRKQKQAISPIQKQGFCRKFLLLLANLYRKVRGVKNGKVF
jgi:hypothetical protein